MSALDLYERLDADMPISWAVLAADLRCEADRCTGDQRVKRIDRAIDCEHRALRLRQRAA